MRTMLGKKSMWMLVIIHSYFPADKTICVTDIPGTYRAEKKNQDPHIYQLPKKTHTQYSHSSTLTPPQKTHKTQNSKKPDKEINELFHMVDQLKIFLQIQRCFVCSVSQISSKE